MKQYRRCEHNNYEPTQCRKHAHYVLGYYYKWGERVDMQKGMIPMWRVKITFRCPEHKDEWASIDEKDRIEIIPISMYWDALAKQEAIAS